MTDDSGGPVFVVVLAAGLATRMGETKQLLPWRGKPILQHVVDAAEASCADDIVVVLGHDAMSIAGAIRLGTRSRIVTNPGFARGQASSLRAGVSAAGDAAAVVVLLGDQPEIRPQTIDAVVGRWRQTDRPVVRCLRVGTPSHPVLLAREVWSHLPETGEEGARHVIAAYPHLVEDLPLGEELPDLDDPGDYRLLMEADNCLWI